MALRGRKKQNLNSRPNIEIKKMLVCITIVNSGQGEAIRKLMEKFSCATSLILKGEGTASKDLYDVLGLKDNYKDVIISFISEDVSDDVIYELNLYFNSNKKNKGVASILEMDSIVSYIGYRFLSNQY